MENGVGIKKFEKFSGIFFVKCFVVHTLKSITLGEEDCRFLSNKSMSLSKSDSL